MHLLKMTLFYFWAVIYIFGICSNSAEQSRFWCRAVFLSRWLSSRLPISVWELIDWNYFWKLKFPFTKLVKITLLKTNQVILQSKLICSKPIFVESNWYSHHVLNFMKVNSRYLKTCVLQLFQYLIFAYYLSTSKVKSQLKCFITYILIFFCDNDYNSL